MKLELNVVRFENEDVIATSCHEAVDHIVITELCTITGTHSYDAGNGHGEEYTPCEVHEGKYVYWGGEMCQHDSPFADLGIGVYHVDYESHTVTPCPNGGISQDQVCGDWDLPEHD